MKLSILKLYIPLLLGGAVFCSCKKEAKLEMNFAEKFEGQRIELMNYVDSTMIASTDIREGKAQFNISPDIDAPIFANLQVDGRIRAFYIIEPGKAVLSDSLNVVRGTPLNDKFSDLLMQLDSIENLGDMTKYVDFAEKCYNDNKDNVLADYFCIEWLKYANPNSVDSLLAGAPSKLRDSRRVQYYRNFALQRSKTSPGNHYIDLTGENAKGNQIKMSNYIDSNKYTLLDFWASWCPYCIKELPELQNLYETLGEKGLEIVGIAVRDKPEDTILCVEKNNIKWPILYNTQKVPYDVYGFSGIPHHILLNPEGEIVLRSENLNEIKDYLYNVLDPQGIGQKDI